MEKGMVSIANPLYDVVFRYMMEDNKVAKLFLSAILGQEILELKFNPTEFSAKIGGEAGFTVTRMDFNALILNENGEKKLVLIEIQRAKFYHQAMRFRRYLGKQYQNKNNIDENNNPIPIYPIYILGESFTKLEIPVIKVKRNYLDVATNEPILEKHPFIEALTHDATVIQTPFLKNHRRTVLEKFLTIFDTSNSSDAKGHILNIKMEDYPFQYHNVINRLQRALVNPTIEETMDLEDDLVTELNTRENALQNALSREEKERAEKEKERAEKEKERAEKEKERAEKEHLLLARNTSIKKMAENGFTVAQIADLVGLSEAQVEAILKTT